MDGSASATIDEYIHHQPRDVQKRLAALRALIHQVAPEAVEKIAYRMPTFYLNGNLVHFAAHARHIGLYPTPSAIRKFERELAGYETSKGAIQLPLDRPMPTALIRKIVQFRRGENLARGKK